MSAQIHYTITSSQPAAHRFVVTIDVPAPAPTGQVLRLPAWIPGSYLVRDFARHVGTVRASCDGEPVAVSKTEKSTWRCAPCDGSLRIEYEVFAHDLSVRGAHLDHTHGFFNGANVFLAVVGQEWKPVGVSLLAPTVASSWRVATTLPRVDASEWGFGEYGAANYDELIDHPVEMGVFDVVEYETAGVTHRVVLSGRHHCNGPRLAKDLTRICAQQVSLFGELPPMEQYLFLTRVLGDGYGGLEHRNSSALMCRRQDLPGRDPKVTEHYRRFLGLCSHEYFHLWNVKRIKPAVFTPYELESESYTELLWVFEGITSYYDDLALVRCGVIDVASYLELVSTTVARVLSVPGQRWQSLAESSFDAWTKFYKPNADTPNSVVSYYAKGALVALLLDLTIRVRTSDKTSLDDVMREMWLRFGKPGHGVPEDGFEKTCEEVTGLDLGPFFDRYVRRTDALDLADALRHVGVELVPDTDAASHISLGVRFKKDSATVSSVMRDGAAQRAGLAPGDKLVALDGLRMSGANWSVLSAPYAPDDVAHLHFFRGDELMEIDVKFDAPPEQLWRLATMDNADEDAVARRAAWLASG
ncbi:MAG: M61 family metallopeptidase [Gammaproteobacteria bacterium]